MGVVVMGVVLLYNEALQKPDGEAATSASIFSREAFRNSKKTHSLNS